MHFKECCVCSAFSENFSSITENYNENTISFHLKSIVPDVEWNDRFVICPVCLGNLSVVITFKELCINSNRSRNVKLEENQEDEIEIRINSDLEDESEEPVNTPSFKLLNKRKYRCLTCGRSFMKERSLSLHKAACDGIGRHSKYHYSNTLADNKCPKCSRGYTTKKILTDHMKSCTGEQVDSNVLLKKIECKYCQSFFFKEGKYITHLRDFHSGENGEIERVENIDKIKRKTRSFKRVDYSFSCNICLVKFKSRIHVFHHCEGKHGIDKNNVKPYLCNFCKQHFSNSAKVMRHIGNHTGEQKCICSHCGKGFKNRDYLKAHERIHTSVRKHPCKICHKSFKTHSNLRIHKVFVHSDPNTWQHSCEYCGRKFPMKSTLKEHLKRHTNERKFTCEVCNLSFISNYELRKHRLRCQGRISSTRCRKAKTSIKKEEEAETSKCSESDLMDIILKIEEGEHVIEVIQLLEDEQLDQ